MNAPAADISPDFELLARCRAGDDRAWRELYRAHFTFVWKTARRLGIPDAERADVCQEVFLVAFRKLDRFRTGRFTTWLYRITANVVSDRHRTRRLRGALRVLWGEQPDERVEPRTPLACYEAREAELVVGYVLARMSPKKREVFALYELEKLPAEQIADRVGCQVETVWSRLHHARRDFEKIARKRGYLVSRVSE